MEVVKRTYVRYDGFMFIDRISALVEATDADLDARIRELETQRRHVEAELAAAIAVADGRSVHLADGHRSMKGYLRATCNWSSGEVSRLRGAARLIDAHSTIGDAWFDGQIGSSQVTELSKVHGNQRVAGRFGEFVPVLIEHAETLPYDDFRVVVQRFVLLADADGAHNDRDAIDARTASVAEVGGALDVRASGGDRLGAAEFMAIFERFVDAEFHRDLAAHRESRCAMDGARALSALRTGRQRRFDALLAMARAAAAHQGLGSKTEPLVSILCDQRTWSW